MLSLVIKKTAINSDGTAITIIDSTGNYNASANPSGYGSPNDARNQVALFLRSYAKRFNNTTTIVNTLLVSTPDNTDHLVVANWSVALLAGKDSWVQSTVYGLHLYSTSTLFQVGELAFDTGTSQIRKIKTVSGTGPYTYTYDVVTEDELEAVGVIIPYTTVYNTYAIPNSCICHEKSNKTWQLSQSKEDWDVYQKIEAFLKAVKYDFGFGSFSEGQKNIEKVEQLCDCFNENCNC